ncbi:hypothetical protein Gura_3457 [Geotalea uraniireducens Rf4]|uniref:Uncharacterized protein n=1 Tax=Geotalea uraniireducens (strain Rf4) TaxID=351605 RepID=A5G745_GEOUR|nr:hypothetical protein Gura_3457 [Geotalea uraniireducens Rf4]
MQHIGTYRFVSLEFNHRKQIKVERINGIPAGESAYRQALVEFGFQGLYRGLEFRRGYRCPLCKGSAYFSFWPRCFSAARRVQLPTRELSSSPLPTGLTAPTRIIDI